LERIWGGLKSLEYLILDFNIQNKGWKGYGGDLSPVEYLIFDFNVQLEGGKDIGGT